MKYCSHRSQCEMKFAHIREANISHLRSKYFTAKLFHLPARANFVEKSTCLGKCFFLAGMAGFEPTDAGVKVPCLTAWRHPNRQMILYHNLVNISSVAVRICPRICFCGESISKNAFRPAGEMLPQLFIIH